MQSGSPADLASGERRPLRRSTRTTLACLATLAVFLLLDLVWLGLVARGIYLDAIGHLMAPAPYVPAVMLFYLLFPLFLAWFAFIDAPDRDNAWPVGLRGALFGLVTYGTYDLTN